MQKNASHFEDGCLEPTPCYATAAEVALADKLRRELEVRYLKGTQNTDGNGPCGPFQDGDKGTQNTNGNGPCGPFQDRNSTLCVENS